MTTNQNADRLLSNFDAASEHLTKIGANVPTRDAVAKILDAPGGAIVVERIVDLSGEIARSTDRLLGLTAALATKAESLEDDIRFGYRVVTTWTTQAAEKLAAEVADRQKLIDTLVEFAYLARVIAEG